MTVEVCPYCRTPIAAEEAAIVCEGCGTPHHADCYAENGGCTIFGCSRAPAEEPKLTVSTPELVSVAQSAPAAAAVQSVLAPPPPPGARSETSLAELRQISSQVVPSMFSLFGNDTPPDATLIQNESEPVVPEGQPKNRTTFIVLGALLGALGAHNFYAGYYKKAIGQLAITGLTLGFGSPMSWIWAIIDICTVNKDKRGVEFQY